MCHSWKNGSQLEKRVTVRKMFHSQKKWVLVRKMCHNKKIVNQKVVLKETLEWSTEKFVTVGKMGQSQKCV